MTTRLQLMGIWAKNAFSPDTKQGAISIASGVSLGVFSITSVYEVCNAVFTPAGSNPEGIAAALLSAVIFKKTLTSEIVEGSDLDALSFFLLLTMGGGTAGHVGARMVYDNIDAADHGAHSGTSRRQSLGPGKSFQTHEERLQTSAENFGLKLEL